MLKRFEIPDILASPLEKSAFDRRSVHRSRFRIERELHMKWSAHNRHRFMEKSQRLVQQGARNLIAMSGGKNGLIELRLLIL